MLKRLTLAISVGLGALAVAAWQSGAIPHRAEYCEKNEDTGQKHCATHHIALVAFWHSGKFVEDHEGAITAIFTIVLAGSTILLWLTTRDLAAGVDEQIKTAVIAAKAAEKSANIAEQSLFDTQRALVLPMRFECSPFVRNNKVIGYRLTVVFENVGTTVAKRFTITSNFIMWDGPLPADFRFPDRNDVGAGKGNLAPHSPSPQYAVVAIKDISDIAYGKRTGFFYGWAEYYDIFKDTPQRRTEFCVQVGIIGDPFVAQPLGSPTALTFGVNPEYNNTDDDCLYKLGNRPPVGGIPPLAEISET